MSTTPIKGYVEQPKWKLDLVNSNKETEERILRELDHLKTQGDIDSLWLARARLQMQQAFMAYNRAIMNPQRVVLPEDINPFEGIA